MNPQIFPYQPEGEYYIDEGCYITELLNSPEDESVSIARARVLPGVTTEWHRLKDTTERYIILVGEGIVEIGDLPAQKVKPNDVILIPPFCHQRITNTGSSDLIFLAVCNPRFKSEIYENCRDK